MEQSSWIAAFEEVFPKRFLSETLSPIKILVKLLKISCHTDVQSTVSELPVTSFLLTSLCCALKQLF